MLTSNIWLSTPENVIQILELPYWQEKKFQKLLTSNIWKLTKDEVDVIFKISLLHEEQFEHLLTSTLWKCQSKNKRNINFRNITK